MKSTQRIVEFGAGTADTLLVGLPRHEHNTEGWDRFLDAYGESIDRWIREGDLSHERKELTRLPVEAAPVKRILFIGLGDRKSLSPADVRAAFGLAGKELRKAKVERAAIWLASFANDDIDSGDVAYLAGEGLTLGGYAFADYKTSTADYDVALERVELLAEGDGEAEAASFFDLGAAYGRAVNEARDLVNLPPNLLTATALAEHARQLGEDCDLEVEILGKQEIEDLGMGGILAVNRGSVEEPRVIVLKYQAGDEWSNPLALVGKGVTYDTGGYSLKPRDGMVGMKGDMGGAAAVLGAMRLIGELRPDKNVIAVIGSTDNMISGEAMKPDDVIAMMDGKTVEVLNTDAEGRLVLADAVSYAKQHGAAQIVDVATLTGGVIVALGNDKTGALTNDAAFFKVMEEAAAETDEFIWRMPLTDSDKQRIRQSDVADLNNSPGRDGHMIFAGGFVGEFAGDLPWIHLDIAGTSTAESAHDLGPKGGTGAMVRTLATFATLLAVQESNRSSAS